MGSSIENFRITGYRLIKSCYRCSGLRVGVAIWSLILSVDFVVIARYNGGCTAAADNAINVECGNFCTCCYTIAANNASTGGGALLA